MTQEIVKFSDIIFHRDAGELVATTKHFEVYDILPRYLSTVFPAGVDVERLYNFLSEEFERVCYDLGLEGSDDDIAAARAKYENEQEVLIFKREDI